MGALRDDEVEDMAHGLSSSLKSWLTFGSSMAPSSATVEADNRMSAIIAKTQPAVDFREIVQNIGCLGNST
jgi:hypothetical protein